MFANSPEDLDSIPGRVIPKTLNMVLDTSLLNTQQYKVRINSKGARGVVVIVVGNGHGDTSSNPGRGLLIAFHIALIPLGKV